MLMSMFRHTFRHIIPLFVYFLLLTIRFLHYVSVACEKTAIDEGCGQKRHCSQYQVSTIYKNGFTIAGYETKRQGLYKHKMHSLSSVNTNMGIKKFIHLCFGTGDISEQNKLLTHCVLVTPSKIQLVVQTVN
jgi:hypothetical protein